MRRSVRVSHVSTSAVANVGANAGAGADVDSSRGGSRNSAHRGEEGDDHIAGEANACPSSFSSSFLQTLHERGFIHQCTDYKSLDQMMSAGPVVPAYLGFDATASSLHVGSLLQIMMLRALQKSGHKPIILMGGGTTKVGDPTGKDESRKLLSEKQIASNVASISEVFEKFLSFGSGPTDAVIVNNADWLDQVKYLEFLRDYGRHFTVNRLLSFESVKQRLARTQPFSFLEFNYLLLQSYDYLQLWRTHKALLQIGGSDQWGNIVSGIELTRKVERVQLYGLTAPLIATSDGVKMGKTESGAVWLDKTLLSEYDYWQFWRNTSDADVIRFMKLFTELPIETIADMERCMQGSKLNAAKVILADEATMLLHGKDCLAGIHATVESLYTNKSGLGLQSLSSLAQVTLSIAESTKLQHDTLTVVDLLVYSHLAESKSEAKRMIKAGAARVNDVKISDDMALVTLSDFGEQSCLKLSSGKKKHILVLLVQ